MRWMRIIAAIAAATVLFGGCANKKPAAFDEGLSLYDQNKLTDALPYFEKASKSPDATADTYAYLAETYRRLGEREKALLADGEALRKDECNSFAHVTLSYIYNPMYGEWEGADREKAWDNIKKAMDCDPNDGNVWLAAWTEAIYNKDEDIERKSLRMMIQTGFFTPAMLAYNRWMLKDLPKDAIILTNGDMDTYPAVAMQEAEGFRSDVAVMNYSLLNTRWYQDHIQERYGIKFPFSAKQLDNLKPTETESGRIKTVASQIMTGIIEAKSKGKFDRPIAISITVADTAFADGYQDHLVLMGPYKLWTDSPSENGYDISAIEASLNGLGLEEFTGPFVSDADRSPVRRVTAGKVADNFIHLAITCVNQETELGHLDKAREMLNWAEKANSLVTKSSEITAELEKLKATITSG